MTNSKVYFVDIKGRDQQSLADALDDLLARLPLSGVVAKDDLAAVKMHFGEQGNTAFVPPRLVRPVVDAVRALGAKPFLCDANTLYVGSRSDSASHLATAHQHGFTYEAMGCPAVIADGLRGGSYVEVEVNGRHLKRVKLAHDLAKCDAIVCASHFKGHELAGFGGAIKNLGMGGGARGAKLAMHSDIVPQVKKEKCTSCGRCAANCPAGAIKIEGYAVIDPAKCIGCGSCIVVCPTHAVRNGWDSGPAKMQEKMVEHLAGFFKLHRGKLAFVNYIINVAPACDCYGTNDPYIVPDIGVCASLDPVALDAASVDLVNQAEGLRGTKLTKAFKPGSDKFRDVYPEVDWGIQLRYAEELGLGSRQYEMVTIA
jgi:uncharacterized Fe-S center protein